MNEKIYEHLISLGLDDSEIKKLPIPFLLSDKMLVSEVKLSAKKLLYESSYHQTSKMPQSFFFKRISSIININKLNEE